MQKSAVKKRRRQNDIVNIAEEKFVSFLPVLDPLTVEVIQGTTNYYNPNCIPLGDTVQYKIDVLPHFFPDEDIIWHIGNTNGVVSFVGSNTGRVVKVKGEKAGDFSLEVETEGHTWHSGSEHPAIFGKVLAPVTNIPVRVWVVADNSGGNLPVTADQVEQVIAEANPILYRETAMRMAFDGTIGVITNESWQTIVTTNSTLDYLCKGQPGGMI